ncbi:hypothetical protein [Legionella nagasakiensis]|uniref:hypothetical protein n=1 Tax=Legionella nagasakiensis TaxID=535290 RepID=UPI00105695AF|nr:hypothetical protein [Legionella nagasakiensis]
MKHYLMLFLSSLTLFMFHDVVRANENKFVSHFYNIESINKHISMAECQALYSEPVYYTIKDDKPVYEPNRHLKILDYQRLQTTFLNKNQWLFLGKQAVSFTLKGKTHNAENLVYFILDKNARTTRGGWYSPGFCKGNLSGMELGLNKWHHHQK